MLTLSNGFQQPEIGDRGGVFFPGLEANIQQVNDHNHNGVNSERITSEAIIALSDSTSLIPVNWVLQASGIWRAPVTMPGALLFADTTIQLRTNNRFLYADVENITINTFYVYVNDPTLTVTVLYI